MDGVADFARAAGRVLPSLANGFPPGKASSIAQGYLWGRRGLKGDPY